MLSSRGRQRSCRDSGAAPEPRVVPVPSSACSEVRDREGWMRVDRHCESHGESATVFLHMCARMALRATSRPRRNLCTLSGGTHPLWPLWHMPLMTARRRMWTKSKRGTCSCCACPVHFLDRLIMGPPTGLQYNYVRISFFSQSFQSCLVAGSHSRAFSSCTQDAAQTASSRASVRQHRVPKPQ
jgi:hypothetical protein